jgi:hypothetical protein
MDVIRLSSLGLQNVQPLHISPAPHHLSLDISKVPSKHQFDRCRRTVDSRAQFRLIRGRSPAQLAENATTLVDRTIVDSMPIQDWLAQWCAIFNPSMTALVAVRMFGALAWCFLESTCT